MAATKIIVTNLASFINALNTASNQDTTCISIELPGPNVLNLSNTITLPTVLGNTRNQLIIEGNGVKIKAGNIWPAPSVPLMNRGSSVTNTSYIIRDINFEGSNNCNGLELNNCIDSVIENCRFFSVNVGLALYECNNFTIKNCQAQSNNAYGYYIVNSNVGSISNSKFIAPNNSGTSTGYYIFGSNAVSMYDCSSTGVANKHIQFDSNGRTDVNSFSMKNINLDDWTNIGIDLALSTGYVKIDGLNTINSGIGSEKPLINASAFTLPAPYPHLYVENVPFLAVPAKFQTTNAVPPNCPTVPQGNTVVWSFKEVYTNGGDLFSVGKWVQGLIPYYRYSEVFDPSKTIVTNYMKVNTNIIS